MINSRNPYDLREPVLRRYLDFMGRCKAAGIDVLTTCTYRDGEAQDAAYAQGRTKPGLIVTSAKAGQSFHQYRVAFDCYPMLHGKIVWGRDAPEELALWMKLGELGEASGLEWGGRWPKPKTDFPHFQYTSGLTLAQLAAGSGGAAFI